MTSNPDYKAPEGYAALGAAYVQAKRYKEAVPVLERQQDTGKLRRFIAA